MSKDKVNKTDNTERTVLGLLRLAGWQSGHDRELTADEAELILDTAASEVVVDDDCERLSEEVLRRRFGTTVPAESLRVGTSDAAPKTLIALLKGESQMMLPELAAQIEMHPAFLLDVSDNPSCIPIQAREEIARRVDLAWNVPTSLTLIVFDRTDRGSTQMAASRSSSFTSTVKSFREIVQRSKLSEVEKNFWLSFT